MCLLQDDVTALHKAASFGRHHVVQLLMDAGMSVDSKGEVSWYVTLSHPRSKGNAIAYM